MTANLSIIGLCLTIFGLFFIVLAIIVKSPRTIMRELLGVRVDRLKTFKHFIAQRIEAALGFLFVLLGASLQIYAKLAEESATGKVRNLGVYLVLTILVMSVAGVLLYRWCAVLARWFFIRMFRNYANRHRIPIDRDESLLVELGDILEIPRDEDETIETFAKKIRRRLELDYKPRRR
jgi:hypothetical protein